MNPPERISVSLSVSGTSCCGTVKKYPASCLVKLEIFLRKHSVTFPYVNVRQSINLLWHSEDRASWYILIMKANEMHYFSDLFDKVFHVFRTCPLSIIRSISTLHTHSSYLSNDKYLLCVYSVEIFLMMDSRHVRNIKSTLSNKFEK